MFVLWSWSVSRWWRGGGLSGGVATAAPMVPAERLALTVTCDSLEVDGDSVLGQGCDTQAWGPLENFDLAGRGGRVFRCQNGWAEGTAWVQGQGCRRIR